MANPDYLISTPENVDLHLELAGVGSRIWANFVDSVLEFLLICLVGLIALLIVLLIAKTDMPHDTKAVLYSYVGGIALLLVFCIMVGYYICFEGLWQGQTPGKRLAHIRVIEANGQPVNWPAVWIRNLLRLIDSGLAVIGVLFMIFDKTERRLGDMAAGTLVIRERDAGLTVQNLRIQSGPVRASYVDAGQLTPDEYQLLTNFLQRRHRMDRQSRLAVGRQLDEYFRLRLNPENRGEAPEEFLEKVYLAYGALAEAEMKQDT